MCPWTLRPRTQLSFSSSSHLDSRLTVRPIEETSARPGTYLESEITMYPWIWQLTTQNFARPRWHLDRRLTICPLTAIRNTQFCTRPSRQIVSSACALGPGDQQLSCLIGRECLDSRLTMCPWTGRQTQLSDLLICLVSRCTMGHWTSKPTTQVCAQATRNVDSRFTMHTWTSRPKKSAL